jgi:hypothetical protein
MLGYVAYLETQYSEDRAPINVKWICLVLPLSSFWWSEVSRCFYIISPEGGSRSSFQNIVLFQNTRDRQNPEIQWSHVGVFCLTETSDRTGSSFLERAQYLEFLGSASFYHAHSGFSYRTINWVGEVGNTSNYLDFGGFTLYEGQQFIYLITNSSHIWRCVALISVTKKVRISYVKA